MIGFNGAADLVFGCWKSGGDDELLVRASAVLKSQERRKMVPWETRSLLGAYRLTLCPGHIMRENPWKKRSWGGVVWRHVDSARSSAVEPARSSAVEPAQSSAVESARSLAVESARSSTVESAAAAVAVASAALSSAAVVAVASAALSSAVAAVVGVGRVVGSGIGAVVGSGIGTAVGSGIDTVVGGAQCCARVACGRTEWWPHACRK